MSKELIEQLAKEHGKQKACVMRPNGMGQQMLLDGYDFTTWELEAFAKAYQAAAPIDNVREALEKAATIALNGCLVPPDGGSPTENEIAMCDDIAKSIRALIPSTQAKKGE
jgi:hypothetical protein